MAEINLLPTDIAATGPLNKIAETLKKVAIVGFLVLILLLAGSGAYLFFLNLQVKDSLASQDELKDAIKSLEQTEQQMVLVKDRVQKAKYILEEDSLTPSIENFEAITTGLPATATMSEANIEVDKTEVAFTVTSSPDLVRFMANILSLDLYKRIELTSFSFTPVSGYSITLALTQ